MNNMNDEFKEDLKKKAQFFMKNGRTYTGEIMSISKNNFINLKDKFDKPVKIAEDDISSVEYDGD